MQLLSLPRPPRGSFPQEPPPPPPPEQTPSFAPSPQLSIRTPPQNALGLDLAPPRRSRTKIRRSIALGGASLGYVMIGCKDWPGMRSIRQSLEHRRRAGLRFFRNAETLSCMARLPQGAPAAGDSARAYLSWKGLTHGAV